MTLFPNSNPIDMKTLEDKESATLHDAALAASPREARAAAQLGRAGNHRTSQSVSAVQLSVDAARLAPMADAQTQQMTGVHGKSPNDGPGRQSSALPALTRFRICLFVCLGE